MAAITNCIIYRIFMSNRNMKKVVPNKKEIIRAKIQNIKHFDRKNIKQKMTIRPFKISVEGNIGAGKTTVINYFSQFPQVETYAEPINWWRHLDGHNLLDLLYKDIDKWYNVFQKYVLLTRLQIQILPPKHSTTTTQIFERSVQINRHTFIEQAVKAGHLKQPDFEVLKRWYEWMVENTDIEIDYIVYLRTTPEIVYERIKSRGRNEESHIPLDYLKQLHETHESWLLNDSKIKNLLIIDADKSIDLVLKQCDENKDKILNNKMVKKNLDYILN